MIMSHFVFVGRPGRKVGSPCSFSVIVQGNEGQDTLCEYARQSGQPPDVDIASGGAFVLLSLWGRTVIRSGLAASQALL